MADQKMLPEDSLGGTSGISEEDQKDILAQIENVASQNRIQVGPELFSVQAKKRGLFVPLVVNVGALAVLALGLLVLYFFFRQSEAGLVQNQVKLQSPEGKLIEELKKESETKLLAKDQQIADIQKQMVGLDKERNDLRTNMDAKIAEKENALKAKLQEALETERKRLAAQGLSEAAIQERLKEFEKKKTAEFQQQLDDFRKKADTDRQALENNLKQQQETFQKNLSDLGSERQRILEDSKKKQSEMQAQLDAKTKDLENQQAASKSQLAAAQQELNKLNDLKTQTESVENQLLGLYTKASQAIQSRQFPEAQKQVQALITYLNDDTVRSLPGIQKRREADLFLANTLSDLLAQEQKRLDADTQRVQVTQSTVETIQSLAVQAENALAAGDQAKAEDFYQQALAQVPSVLESHEYFLNKSLKAEQLKQKTFTDILKNADALMAKGNAQEALNQYNSALEYLPLAASQRDDVLGRYAQAAANIEMQKQATKLDTDLTIDVTKAQLLLKTGNPQEALGAFAGIIEKYSIGKVGFAAVTGIRQASADLQGPTPQQKALEDELAKVQAQKDALEKDKADLVKQLADSKTATGQQEKIAALEKQIDDLKKNQGSGNNGADPAELKKAKEEIARLTGIVQVLDQMKTKYKDFVTRDTDVWKQGTSSAVVLQSKLLLDSFLTAPEVATAFPGLNEKVGRYDKAFQDAGQKETLVNVNDVMANFVKLKSPAERRAYVSTLKKRYAENPAMSQFVTSLGKF